MATTKKPTAKQLAARRKFVAAVRAGKFRKKPAARKRAPAKKAAPRKAPARRKAATSRTVRTVRTISTVKRNPLHNTRVHAPLAYCVHKANAAGGAGELLAGFRTKAAAVAYAQAYANGHRRKVVIVGKGR